MEQGNSFGEWGLFLLCPHYRQRWWMEFVFWVFLIDTDKLVYLSPSRYDLPQYGSRRKLISPSGLYDEYGEVVVDDDGSYYYSPQESDGEVNSHVISHIMQSYLGKFTSSSSFLILC